MEHQTVVVTGASAGIGRATARLFGERGASVGLIARGEEGLAGAVRDVEEAGGKALAVSADVADYRAGRRRRPSDRGGPRPDRRVGQRRVHLGVLAVRRDHGGGVPPGHRGQLPRVRVRDDGRARPDAAARAGHDRAGRLSAGSRSIPLQSAYCGAKHAINGFTESLRCELLHDKSGVHVTVVQMPAVNTPQFSWVRSRLPNHPQPVPPIYQPEVAARGVVFAADHPRRKQYWVGGSTAATILANRVAPALLDRYLARTGYDSQQTDQPADPGQQANLLQPVDGATGHDFGAHGVFDDRSHGRSVQLWLSQHARVSAWAARRGRRRRGLAGEQAGPPPVTAPVRPAAPADARRRRGSGITPTARRLQLARASYGVALVMAPGLVTYLATGRFPRPARAPGGAGARRPPPAPGRGHGLRPGARCVRAGRGGGRRACRVDGRARHGRPRRTPRRADGRAGRSGLRGGAELSFGRGAGT